MIRTVFQSFGAIADWDSPTKIVAAAKASTTVKLQIGSGTATTPKEVVAQRAEES
ncbi:stalk domain-containing protein [Desulfoscipio gibsoniae]